jgi:Flp pilus assembly protein TadB
VELAVALLVSGAVLAWTAPDISFQLQKKKIDRHTKISLVLGAACVLLSLLMKNIYAAVLCIILMYFFDKSGRIMERRNQSAALDAQIGTALQIISSLYAVTGNLIDVLQKTADCIEAPLSLELKRTVSDYYKGASLKDSLQGLAKRVPSRYLQIFVSGVIEAEKFGTDPGEVISGVVGTINDHVALNEDLKNELRGQKMTIYALLVLLPVMAVIAMALFPQAKEILTQSFVGKMIVCGIFLVEYVVWALSARGEVQRWQF